MDMKPLLRRTALCIPLAACVACGSTQVRGQSPFVSVSSLAWSGQAVEVSINIRNINDVAMNTDQLTVTMQARDAVLLRHSGPTRLSIDPNTTEDITLAHTPDATASERLRSLQAGETDSLPFSLEGRVHTAEDGDLQFRHQGYLFRVPGRPGQFRARPRHAPRRSAEDAGARVDALRGSI